MEQEKQKYSIKREIKTDIFNKYKKKEIDLEKEVISDLITYIPLEELKKIFKIKVEEFTENYVYSIELTRITVSIEI